MHQGNRVSKLLLHIDEHCKNTMILPISKGYILFICDFNI